MTKAIGRNDPCPCGCGKKYKHCCLYPDGAKEDRRNKITAIAALVVVLIAIGIGMVFGWEPAAAIGLLGVLAYRIFIDPPVRHSDDPDPPELW